MEIKYFITYNKRNLEFNFTEIQDRGPINEVSLLEDITKLLIKYWDLDEKSIKNERLEIVGYKNEMG